MVKPPYIFTDTESDDISISSAESKKKKKKRFSILKYTRRNRNVKKQKCKIQSKSEPDDSDYHSKTRSYKVRYKPGILKYSYPMEREREIYFASDDDDSEPIKPKDKYLVGSVPRTAGTRPGRGGGVAILVRRHVNSVPQSSTTTPKRKMVPKIRRLSRKRSY